MIDRDAERDWLHSHLTSDTEDLLVLYGRRRVGKTTLVTSVLNSLDTPTFYYLCDERGTTQNARRFADHCATELDDIPPDVDGFVDAFEYLTRRLDSPAVVAFDEFSYLVDEDDTIPSVFQTIVDQTLDGTGISLVLLGSSISMMEEGVLSYESPLYGRRTGQWRMEPMTLGDAAGFFPDYDPRELIEAYSILGGIPAYLEQFDTNRALLDNVEQFVLSKGAFLNEEPEFLLRQELREPPTYMAILEAIAGGATRVSEIGNEIDRDASSISRYLQNLTRIALVERETPVTDPDGRGVYRITDQFLRFWFRYVLPNRATLEQGNTTPVRRAIENTLSEHTSWTFETVCRQVVRTAAFPVTCSRVGRWWYGENEIDVAGINEQTETLLLGECKWTTGEVGHGLLADLEALESDVRWHGTDRSVVYALFAREGFTSELQEAAASREDLRLFTPGAVVDLFETSHSS
ncbi:ATP-binding protein [Halorubellus litoreus]|uniref:ATP-binding protein n=1 Tax=Halorubellus litoreus TaxID=755308 RepID=A0ABD5VLT0_9EURY